MSLPVLTPEQRTANLAKAAVARKARAKLRNDLKTGTTTLATVLKNAHTDAIAGKTQIVMLLTALPGVGKITALAALDELDISHRRTARGLGPVQHQKLLARFASN